MSADAAVVTRAWSVGAYTVRLTLPRPVAGETRSAAFEWSPSRPDNLTPTELEQYRAGRDAALADLARAVGLRVAVVEA